MIRLASRVGLLLVLGLLLLIAIAATSLPRGPNPPSLPTTLAPGTTRAVSQAAQEPSVVAATARAADEEDASVLSSDQSVLAHGCTFFLVRHGQSRPNIAGKIVSGMTAGVDPANGLTELGLDQARTAGKELKEVLVRAGCSPANTIVLTSPFSRAKETAEAIRDCLECELREERDLRERFFGEFDGHDDAASYAKVWALDALSGHHGELGVEPAAQVAVRTAAVVHRARKEVSIRQRFYSGEDGQPFPPGPSAVILVSHGDALQVLQCALAGRPVEQHRSLPHLENCGIRVLRPPPLGAEGGEEEEDEGADRAVGQREEERGMEERGADGDGGGSHGGGRGDFGKDRSSGEAAGAFRMTGARVFRTPKGERSQGTGGGRGSSDGDGDGKDGQE